MRLRLALVVLCVTQLWLLVACPDGSPLPTSLSYGAALRAEQERPSWENRRRADEARAWMSRQLRARKVVWLSLMLGNAAGIVVVALKLWLHRVALPGTRRWSVFMRRVLAAAVALGCCLAMALIFADRLALLIVSERPQAPAQQLPANVALALWCIVDESGSMRLEPFGALGVMAGDRPSGSQVAFYVARSSILRTQHAAGIRRRQLRTLAEAVVLAGWISRNWTTDQLVAALAGSVGYGAYSTAREASLRTFGLELSELSIEQAASLAAMTRRRRSAEAQFRDRNQILCRMARSGRVPLEAVEQAVRSPHKYDVDGAIEVCHTDWEQARDICGPLAVACGPQ